MMKIISTQLYATNNGKNLMQLMLPSSSCNFGNNSLWPATFQKSESFADLVEITMIIISVYIWSNVQILNYK